MVLLGELHWIRIEQGCFSASYVSNLLTKWKWSFYGSSLCRGLVSVNVDVQQYENEIRLLIWPFSNGVYQSVSGQD